MSIHFGKLPFYAPKYPAQEPDENLRIGGKPTSDFFRAQVKENEMHVREVELAVEDLSPEIAPWLQKEKIGTLHIASSDGTRIAHACVSPLGFVHLTPHSGHSSLETESDLATRLRPLTIAVDAPKRDEWASLKSRGYLLRSDFVRWFAPVGSAESPTEHLAPARAKKMRDNISKAKKDVRIEVEPMTAENFNRWLQVYEEEVAGRPNGLKIFYCNIFAAGQKLEGMLLVSCYESDLGEYLGGCVVNTWGGFGDIGKEPRKYTTFLMSAFKKSGREHALGYLLDEAVMGIARDLGDKVYGHGGDMAFWGTDIRPGLLGRKSACGMEPFPEGRIEAFKVVDPERVLAQSDEGFYLVELAEDCPQTEEYFSKRDTGWDGAAQEVFHQPYSDIALMEVPKKIWTIHHFGKKLSTTPIPEGLPLIEHTV